MGRLPGTLARRRSRDNFVALASRRGEAFPGRAAVLSDRYDPAVPHARSAPIVEVGSMTQAGDLTPEQLALLFSQMPLGFSVCRSRTLRLVVAYSD